MTDYTQSSRRFDAIMAAYDAHVASMTGRHGDPIAMTADCVLELIPFMVEDLAHLAVSLQRLIEDHKAETSGAAKAQAGEFGAN